MLIIFKSVYDTCEIENITFHIANLDLKIKIRCHDEVFLTFIWKNNFKIKLIHLKKDITKLFVLFSA